ncbi:MAG: hypothetical protein GWN86_10245, partial [Desulfobacterales bacterium]|nr:hypothetical protein [Desulfobacterales bacterium]
DHRKNIKAKLDIGKRTAGYPAKEKQVNNRKRVQHDNKVQDIIRVGENGKAYLKNKERAQQNGNEQYPEGHKGLQVS